MKSFYTIKVILLLISFIFISRTSYSQDIEQEIDNYMNAYNENGYFSGSVLVAKNGTVFLSKGYGMADIGNNVKNTAATVHQIGSVSKQFTAAAIMQLQEKNMLSIKDNITKYLPEFPQWKGITIENLLNHTSGIANYTDKDGFMNYIYNDVTPMYILETVKNDTLDFKIGSSYKYSNTGYIILGYIIEKVSGKSYKDYIKENLFEPAGMYSSYYDDNVSAVSEHSKGYAGDQEVQLWNISTAYSAGAIASTVGDLYKWNQALYGGKIVTQSSLNAMTKPGLKNYGYGLIVSDSGRMVWHNGHITGYLSALAQYPKDNITIVVLSNNEIAPADKIIKDLAAIMTGKPYQMPEVRKEVTVDTKVYQQYVGEYQLAPQFIITITTEGDKIYGQATGQQKVELFPLSETEYFIKVVDAKLAFHKDDKGNVTPLTLFQNGMEIPGKKVK